MHLRNTPYTPPIAPFKAGQMVWFEGKRRKVETCTHTHAQLAGLNYAVAVWQCRARLRNSTDSTDTHTSVRSPENFPCGE